MPSVDEIQDEVEARRAKELEEEGRKVLGDEDEEEISDEEIETLAQKKRRIAQLLDRGYVADRLDARKHLGSRYDEGRVYEWIRETDQDIDRAKAIGFRLEEKSEEETEATSHGAGDTRIRIGDVVLMSIPKEDHEIIQEIKAEKRARRLESDPGRKDYRNRARKNPFPVIDESEVSH